MKAVSNRKTWDDMGWLYRMERVVNGMCIQQNLAITKYEMHHRNVVAMKLRKARSDLHMAVMRKKYPYAFRSLDIS